MFRHACPIFPYISCGISRRNIPNQRTSLGRQPGGSDEISSQGPCNRHLRPEHAAAASQRLSRNPAVRWQCVATAEEIDAAATEFDPTIALCWDERVAGGREVLLDSLELIGAGNSAILVLRINEGAEPQTALLESLLRAEQAKPPTAKRRPRRPALPDEMSQLRASVVALLDASSEPVAICNARGFITHANLAACTALGRKHRGALGTTLDSPTAAHHSKSSAWPTGHIVHFNNWASHPRRIHINELLKHADPDNRHARGTRALVAVDATGPRIPEISGLTIPETGSDQPSGADASRCGWIVRLTPDDYLFAIPQCARSADAAKALKKLIDLFSRPQHRDKMTARSVVEAVGASAPRQAHPRSDFERESRLRDALNLQALHVQYQPQFELDNGRGCGVEALARWTRFNGEVVPPSIFIPIAERTNLITALGEWILRSACAMAGATRTASSGQVVAVNVSPLQFGSAFYGLVEKALNSSGLAGSTLQIEITEGARIADNPSAIECLNACRRLGVRIALDDFGVGYSGLQHLAKLPVDCVKIDQSLVHMLGQDPKGASIIKSVIELGGDLGVDVVAEGVETEQQLQMLGEFECPKVQGYLLARPMPATQARIVLEKPWGNRPHRAPQPARTYTGAAHVH